MNKRKIVLALMASVMVVGCATDELEYIVVIKYDSRKSTDTS